MGGVYTVSDGESTIKCYPRGKLRRQGEIYIGDFVDVECDKEGIIEGVRPRRSCLTRPYVANIDAVIQLTSSIYQTDFRSKGRCAANLGLDGMTKEQVAHYFETGER